MRVLAGLAVVWVVSVGCGPAGVTSTPPPTLTPEANPTALAVPTPTAPIPTGTPDTPERAPSAAVTRHRQLAPTRIRIPAIGVDSTQFMPLGLAADRSLQVPPVSTPEVAGWYVGAPVPGNPGSGVVVSHVDGGDHEKGLFWGLSKLHVGDLIYVSRSDGKTAEFKVTRTGKFCKEKADCQGTERPFPTQDFYSNQSQAQLHLATCGGRFQASTKNYLDQILIWSMLVKLS